MGDVVISIAQPKTGSTEKLTRLTSLDSTPRVSDSVGLGWGLRICLCYKFSGDAHAVSGDRILGISGLTIKSTLSEVTRR